MSCRGCICSSFVAYCADNADMSVCYAIQTKVSLGNVSNPAPILWSSLTVVYGTCCLKPFYKFLNYCLVGNKYIRNLFMHF
jgi:hypothetical protein